MKHARWFGFLVLFAAGGGAAARADILVNVNIHNGNVYFSETDFRYGMGAMPLEITRNYNSRSLHDGIFGFGWSSILETYFEFTPEGNIWVHEVGGGDTILLTCDGFKPSSLDAVIDILITKLKEKRPELRAQSSQFWAQQKVAMREDITKRIEAANSVGFRSPVQTAAKAVCRSTQKGSQVLRKTASGGWIRSRMNAGEERFDEKGRIVGVASLSGDRLAFTRDGRTGLVNEIRSNQGAGVRLGYDSAGKVTKVLLPDGRSIVYTYKDVPATRLLVSVKQPGGSEIKYDYTQGMYIGNYNINSVEVGQQKSRISYDIPKDVVTRIDDPDGTTRTFDYNLDRSNNDHYSTRVKYTKGGQTTVDTNFEYWWKQRVDGTKYIYQSEKTENKEKVRTVYSECCGLPIEISKNGQTTKFDYFPEGLLKSKTKPDGSKIALEYHPEFRKVTKVVRNLAGQAKALISTYQYDKKGNLNRAIDDKGNSIVLTYDPQMRIKTMQGKEYGLLSFDYNSMGKPSHITERNVGSVTLKYNDAGEVIDAQSKQGGKIAFQVTAAFQSLLQLIAPASVPLTAD
jgi:YD repeat-containing protein